VRWGVSQKFQIRETVRETVFSALSPRGQGEPPTLTLPSLRQSCERSVVQAESGNGAAQESNLPSRGLHDRTGFEGPPYEVQLGAIPHGCVR
jgi:hypothetical protein